MLPLLLSAQTTCNQGIGKVVYERLPDQQLQGFDDDVVSFRTQLIADVRGYAGFFRPEVTIRLTLCLSIMNVFSITDKEKLSK